MLDAPFAENLGTGTPPCPTGALRTGTDMPDLYLLEDRPNAKNLCEKGTVVGVHGFIILPDDWKTPRGLTWQE